MTPKERLEKLRRLNELRAKGRPAGQGMAGGLFDAFTQGAAFGFGDELTALESAALGRTPDGGWFQYDQPFGQRYEQALEAERSQQEHFREENPALATGAEATGALTTAIATPLGMLGAPAHGASLAMNMARAGGAGAGMGALYGYGTGEGGVGSRLQNVPLAAGAGAVAGGAAPVIGAGVGRLTRNLMQRPAAQQAGLSRPAFNMMQSTLADDVAMGGGVPRLRQGGPGAMLADAGPGSAGMLDAVAQIPGGRQVALPAVQARATQANRAIGGALDDALGPARGIAPTERGLRQGTAAARSGAYQAAYSQPIDYASNVGRQIESLVSTRVPRAAINRANSLIRAEGGGVPQILVSAADDGSVAFREMPNVQQIDYITRALNDVASAADGQGALGGVSNVGRVYRNLSRDLRGLLREAVPEYATALDTAAQPIAARNALQMGNRLLSRGITRDEAADMLSGMSVAERQYVAQGVRSQIDDALANVRRTLTDPNMEARQAVQAVRDLSSGASRDKLRLLLGNEAADSLFGQIDQATAALDLRAAMAQNSKTAPRQLFNETLREQTDEGALNALRHGEPMHLAREMWQGVTGATPAAKSRVQERAAAELAEALTGPRGQDAIDLLNLILRGAERGDLAGQELGRLTQLLLLPGRAAAAPAAEQYLR